VKTVAAVLLVGWMVAAAATGDELAVYLASGPDAALFDQYDNDGYSLAVLPGAAEGVLQLRVRVSAGPLQSRAPFPTGLPADGSLPVAVERDEFARALSGDARTEAEAVERILAGLASSVRYDGDKTRRQDPAAVFESRRASCVGIAELAVDLLRRVGITARTVQGILRSKAGADGYDPRIGGVYHRWIEIYYPDRGFVFSDPSSSINSVDSRYLPFRRRAFERPHNLTLTPVESSGSLGYPLWRLPLTTLRVRPVGSP
jgi:transglutaminase-like putative cysteine protease